MAPINSFVIGGNLYQTLKKSFSIVSQDNLFRLIGEYSLGLKQSYPIYQVTRKNHNHDEITINCSVENNSTSLVQSSYEASIMLIEDDVDSATTFKAILESEGIKLDVFTNPCDALKHFVQSLSANYRLIILDIRMPRVNGIQLFHKLKSIAPNIKIVFFSALDGATELVSLFPDVNHEHILRKPATSEEIVSWIKKHLQ